MAAGAAAAEGAKQNSVASTKRSLVDGDSSRQTPKPSHKKSTLNSDARPTSVYVFGTGDCGQLALGEDTLSQPTPTKLAVLDRENCVAVAAGGMHTLALAADGSLFSWGCNDEKALGHAAAEFEVGRVECFVRSSSRPTKTSDSTALRVRIVDVAAGDSISAAVADDGVLYAWGTFRDSSGVLGYDAKTHVCPVPTAVSALSGVFVERVYAGANHLIAVAADGAAFAWGCGEQGQLGRRIVSRHRLLSLRPQRIVPSRKRCADGSVCRYVKFSCGAYHTLALTNDGAVYAWGLNNHGQLGVGDTDDRVTAAPLDRALFGGQPIVDVAAGEHHSIVVTAQGAVYAFGRADSHQLGVEGVVESSPIPVHIPTLANVCAVAAGASHCFAIDAAGAAFAWGFGECSQLGTGKERDEATPVRIASLAGTVVQASGGAQHSVFLVASQSAV